MPNLSDQISSTEQVADLPLEDRKNLALVAMSHMSDTDRADVQNRVGLGSPGRRTTNWIWKAIVGTLCIVALTAVVTLATAALLKIDVPPMLTVFTTAAGFLAGLMTPSPASDQKADNSG